MNEGVLRIFNVVGIRTHTLSQLTPYLSYHLPSPTGLEVPHILLETALTYPIVLKSRTILHNYQNANFHHY